MIVSVNLNPCIDKTVLMEDFRINSLNRVCGTRMDAAGKGINVSIVLKQLGYADPICLGFNYSKNGEIITQMLISAGIQYELVEVEGFLRTNMKVLDTKNGTYTEINEKGTYVEHKYLDQIRSLIHSYAKNCSVLSLNGSVPENVPPDIYKTIIHDVQSITNAKIILDAEGELLRQGLLSQPYLVKPNLYELTSTFNKKAETVQDISRLSKELIQEYGVKIVCVSMGENGAVISDQNESYHSPALNIKAKAFQGAGDSMVAGICLAISKGLSLSDLLRYGMAAAAGSVVREGTLLCTRYDFDQFLSQITLRKIAL